MGRLKLTRTHKRGVAIAAITVAALMLADAAYQIGMHVVWRRWLPETMAGQNPTTQPAGTQPAATQPADTQPADQAKKQKKKPSKPPEIDAAIKKRNIFTKVKRAGHGMKLTGVIGNIALFAKGGNTVGVEEGKSEHGIKVVSIKDYEVTIEFKGKQETMKLFSGKESRGGTAPGPGRRPQPPAGSEEAASVTTQPSVPDAPASGDAERMHKTPPAIRRPARGERFKRRAITQGQDQTEAVIRIEEEP